MRPFLTGMSYSSIKRHMLAAHLDRPNLAPHLACVHRMSLPSGTVLGSYPGRVRSGAEMARKVQSAPKAAEYAFRQVDKYLCVYV